VDDGGGGDNRHDKHNARDIANTMSYLKTKA